MWIHLSIISLNGIGVLADGRCLFRAIAHGACLRNGEEAPDENHQRELADELRAQVRWRKGVLNSLANLF